jgi:hypothetical protein
LSDGIKIFSLIAEGFDSSTLSATDFVKNDIVRQPDTNKTILFFDLPPVQNYLHDLRFVRRLVRNINELQNSIKF